MKLISINEAVDLKIERLRKPIWATPEDHIKIDIFNEKMGPLIHLYAPFNMECNGQDPVNVIAFQMDCDAKEWLDYQGPEFGSDAYKAAQARYAGCLKDPTPTNP